MTGAAMLLLGGNPLTPERRFSLRWAWRRHAVAGQVAEFDHLVAAARAGTPEDDPAPRAVAALARNRALGWRALLAEHERIEMRIGAARWNLAPGATLQVSV